jgi:hypothetical protein
MRKPNLILALGLIVSLACSVSARPRYARSSLQMAFAYLDEASTTGDVRAKLLSSVSTEISRVGDSVTARVLSPEALSGAILEGSIRLCKKGGKLSGDAALMFSFDKLEHQGRRFPIKATVESVFSRDEMLEVASEGILLSTNDSPEITALAALNGGFAGGFKWFGIGAGIGAGVAAGAQLLDKPPIIFLRKGTELMVSFD